MAQKSSAGSGVKSLIKKKWPLADASFFTDAFMQPRVISVLSYYLTSLVNLSFCRLVDGTPISLLLSSALLFHNLLHLIWIFIWLSWLSYARNRCAGLSFGHLRRPLVLSAAHFFMAAGLFDFTVFGYLLIFFVWLLQIVLSILLPAHRFGTCKEFTCTLVSPFLAII